MKMIRSSKSCDLMCKSGGISQRADTHFLWSAQGLVSLERKFEEVEVSRVVVIQGVQVPSARVPLIKGVGGVDVVVVVTPLVRGGAQVLHGDQVVELSVLLEVHEKEEEGEDGEGQIEVESERGELKEKRTCTWMT